MVVLVHLGDILGRVVLSKKLWIHVNAVMHNRIRRMILLRHAIAYLATL